MRTSPVTSPQRKRSDSKDEESEMNFSYSPLSSAMNSPSGRDLYVGSPSTASRRSNGTRSEDMDPPPPYSSPTRSTASHASSSKYTEIMQFLDKDMESTLPRGGQEFLEKNAG